MDNVSCPFGTKLATYFVCKSSKGQQHWVRKDSKQRKDERQDKEKEKGEKEKASVSINKNNKHDNNN